MASSISIISSTDSKQGHSLIQSSKQHKTQRPLQSQQQQSESDSSEENCPLSDSAAQANFSIVSKDNSKVSIIKSNQEKLIPDEGIRRSSKRLKSKQSIRNRTKMKPPPDKNGLNVSSEDMIDTTTGGNGYQVEYHEELDEEDELVQVIQTSSTFRKPPISDFSRVKLSTDSVSRNRDSRLSSEESESLIADADEEEESPLERLDEENIDTSPDLDANLPSTEDSSPVDSGLMVGSAESSPPQLNTNDDNRTTLMNDEDESTEASVVEEEEEEETNLSPNGDSPVTVTATVMPLITPKLEGQSWSKLIFARNNNRDSNNSTSIKDSESSSSPASFTEWNRRKNGLRSEPESEIMTLKREDMAIYGICPARDKFFVTNCDFCGQVVKYQALARHIELRHGNANNGHNSILPNIETPPPSTRSEASSSSSSESYPLSNADNGHEEPLGGTSSHNHRSDHANHEPNGTLTVPSIKIKTGSATSPPRLIVSPSSRGHSPSVTDKSSNNHSDNHSRSTDSRSVSLLKSSSASPTPNVSNCSTSSSNTRLKLMLSSPSVTISAAVASPKTSTLSSDKNQGSASLPSSPASSPLPVGKSSQCSSRASKGSKNSAINSSVSLSILKEKLLPCKDRQYHADKHCGVKTDGMNKPCTRSLTCKSHSLTLRRQVLGRSEEFDALLERHRVLKEEALRALGKEIKPTKKQLKAREVEARKAAAAQAKLDQASISSTNSNAGSRPPSRPPSRAPSNSRPPSRPSSPAVAAEAPPKITITTTTTGSSKSNSGRSSTSSNTIIINSSSKNDSSVGKGSLSASALKATALGSGSTVINNVHLNSSLIKSVTGKNLDIDGGNVVKVSNHTSSITPGKEFTKIQIKSESGMTIINSNLLPDSISSNLGSLTSKNSATGLSSKNLKSTKKRQLSASSDKSVTGKDVTVSLVTASESKPVLNQFLSSTSSSSINDAMACLTPDEGLRGPVLCKLLSRSESNSSSFGAPTEHAYVPSIVTCEETGMALIDSKPEPISINKFNCRYLNLNEPISLLAPNSKFKSSKIVTSGDSILDHKNSSKNPSKKHCTGGSNQNLMNGMNYSMNGSMNNGSPNLQASLINGPLISGNQPISPFKSYPTNYVACPVYNRKNDFVYSKLRSIFTPPSAHGQTDRSPIKSSTQGVQSMNQTFGNFRQFGDPNELNSNSRSGNSSSGKRLKK